MSISEKRISVLQNGLLIPIVEGVRYRSATLAARGVLLEQHAIGKTEFPKRTVQSHVVFLYTGQSVEAHVRSTIANGRVWMRPGTVWVMPHGTEHSVSFTGKVEGLSLSFDMDHFAHLLHDTSPIPAPRLDERIVTGQATLGHLMKALWSESHEASEPGLLAAESIATALAIRLVQPTPEQETRLQRSVGLTGRQVHDVLSFVRDNISQTMSLKELAGVVGLSPYHFLRAFKQATGSTPHQYVLEQRIAYAKDHLRSTKSTIMEVAVMAGFSQASHFARSFRKQTGMSPRQYVSRS